MRDRRITLLFVFVSGCASSRAVPPQKQVDLGEARKAVEAARSAGAINEALTRAVQNLQDAEAEMALGEKGSPDRAEWLGRLAQEGARCALEESELKTAAEAAAPAPTPSATPSREVWELRRKLDDAQADERRLMEEKAGLQRERDNLAREALRVKARLKGSATVEEASSAIAEARVLVNRIPPEQSGGVTSRCLDLIREGEDKLRQESYGPAVLLALDAQDQASKWLESHAERARAEARKSYTARTAANLRQEPSTSAPILKTLAPGEVLEGLSVLGDWVNVRAGGMTGWVSRSLLE
jgi:hypothetical protein